jgi:glycine/D-amino acid oxidase-like deaminating enzyme|tara:strand:+ start:15836 stop:16570 length:735 start_codon:yes stop_codon:yes gene_type:complete
MSPASATTSTNTTTVIIGSGIIGLSTAYYLSEGGNTDPKSICLLDASPELFCCASGLAGGFLAADCMYVVRNGTRRQRLTAACATGFAPSVKSLGALSFKLHAALAHAHNGRETWGYAHSTGISLSQDSESAVGGSGEDWLESGTSRAQLANHNRPWEEEQMGPLWLRRAKEATMEVISQGGTTAQIDPMRFCQWLLAQCQRRGVHVRHPVRALSVSRDDKGILNGIRISENGVELERKTSDFK